MERYDLSGIEQVVVGGDGAGWIKEGVDYFGGKVSAMPVSPTVGYVSPGTRDQEMLRSLPCRCNHGEFDAAFTLLKEAAARAKVHKAKDIRRTIRYLSSNASGLRLPPVCRPE